MTQEVLLVPSSKTPWSVDELKPDEKDRSVVEPFIVLVPGSMDRLDPDATA